MFVKEKMIMHKSNRIHFYFRVGLIGAVILFFVILFNAGVFAKERNHTINNIEPLSPMMANSSSLSTPFIFLPILMKPSHLPTQWHELTQETGHHHGVNPANYVDIFGQTLTDYLNAYGSISYPWQTPNENFYKHQGYLWLYDEAENGCEQFNITGNPNCVTHILVQLHSMGTPLAVRTRIHSQYAFIRICTPDGLQCGIATTGGHADYGILHAPYKEFHCVLDSDPPGFGALSNVLHQPPYKSNSVEYTPSRAISQFWNSLGPNAITLSLFPPEPNWVLGLAWSSPDAWGALDPADCGNLDAATIPCPDGSCEYNHSKFHIFSVRIQHLPTAPFTGWTNRWGHIVTGCTVANVDCVPFTVTAGVPEGTAWLNRQVNQGAPDTYAPAQEFDVFDENGKTKGWITFPMMPPMP
jgi:hypothetical protein